MRQLHDFSNPGQPDYICRLTKAFYGLKQAPRALHARLATALRDHGFAPSIVDSSLLLQKPEVTMYLLVYVDDIILVSSSQSISVSYRWLLFVLLVLILLSNTLGNSTSF
jgi:hypothetical protein